MDDIYSEKDKEFFRAIRSIGQMIYRSRIQDKTWGMDATPLEIHNLWISKEGFAVDPTYLTMLLEHIDYLRTGSLAIIGEALLADELISKVERDIGVSITMESKNSGAATTF